MAPLRCIRHIGRTCATLTTGRWLRNIAIVLLSAAATTTAALTLEHACGGSTAEATAVVKPVIPEPELVSGGCAFKVKTDKPVYLAGQSPIVTVLAHNRKPKPADVTVTVTIAGAAPVAPTSRLMPVFSPYVPNPLWSHDFDFKLPGGKVSHLTVSSDVKLPAGQEVRIFLNDNKNSVLSSDFAPKSEK